MNWLKKLWEEMKRPRLYLAALWLGLMFFVGCEAIKLAYELENATVLNSLQRLLGVASIFLFFLSVFVAMFFKSPQPAQPAATSQQTGACFPAPATIHVAQLILLVIALCLIGLYLTISKTSYPGSVDSIEGIEGRERINEALIVAFAAGLGSSIAVILAYIQHASVDKDFDPAYVPWFLGRQLTGMLLGLIFYFLLRGGVLLAVAPTDNRASLEDLNDWGLAGIGALVGLFSRNAMEKLKEVFHTLFRTEKQMAKSDESAGDRLLKKLKLLSKDDKMNLISTVGADEAAVALANNDGEALLKLVRAKQSELSKEGKLTPAGFEVIKPFFDPPQQVE